MKTKKKTVKGKFIVIEGGDGAGKGTQLAKLKEALKAQGVKVFSTDFPRYDSSLFGALCGRALKGEFGDFRHLDPHLASLCYTLDRVSAKREMEDMLKRGILASNKYTPSNVAYQAAKLRGKKKKEFIDFLERAEYGELGLPKPDLVIYLYVPPRISHQLVAKKDARSYLGQKKGKRDQHEQDFAYQQAVVKTYIKLAKARPDWVVINCVKKGKLMSVEEIHALVYAQVSKLL